MRLMKLVKILSFSIISLILLALAIGYYLMSHPPHHEMYFNIDKQQLICCDKIKLGMLHIDDDSHKESISLFWEHDKTINNPPEFLDLNNIPNGYKITSGGLKRKKPFRLPVNSSYTIEKSGGGSPSFKIRIWTDSKGKVYKTTHSECGLKSLEEDGYVNTSN